MRRAVLILATLVTLGACGKNGAPDPPQPDQYPKTYPKAEILPETGDNGQLPGWQVKTPGAANPLYQTNP